MMLYRAERGELTFAATGDSLITRPLSVHGEDSFMDLVEVLRSADAAFTNLEGLIHDYESYPAARSGGTWMRGAPEILGGLQWMGFQLCSTANNHSLDYGIGGLESTICHLRREGMTYAGTGMSLAEARAPGYLDTAGGRIALLAASTTFRLSNMAGQQRPDMQGNPGLSGLRHRVEVTLTPRAMRDLRRARTLLEGEKDEEDVSLRSMRASAGSVTFCEGPEVDVSTEPHPDDLRDICRWVDDARRQADWVVFSLHAHESKNGDPHVPADFIRAACREIIEAGADMVVGHGPHVLRGIEIHRGRPIMYSLGNFIYQNQTVSRLPQGFYETFGLGLEATPADAYDARSDNTYKVDNPAYWESLVPVVRFEDWELQSINVYPAALGFGKKRSQRGRPVMARGDEAQRILEKARDLSEPFGTELLVNDDVATVIL